MWDATIPSDVLLRAACLPSKYRNDAGLVDEKHHTSGTWIYHFPGEILPRTVVKEPTKKIGKLPEYSWRLQAQSAAQLVRFFTSKSYLQEFRADTLTWFGRICFIEDKVQPNGIDASNYRLYILCARLLIKLMICSKWQTVQIPGAEPLHSNFE